MVESSAEIKATRATKGYIFHHKIFSSKASFQLHYLY